jgi:hypothetical protein
MLLLFLDQVPGQFGADGFMLTLHPPAPQQPTSLFASGACLVSEVEERIWKRADAPRLFSVGNATPRWSDLKSGREEWSVLSLTLDTDHRGSLIVAAVFRAANPALRAEAEIVSRRLFPLLRGFLQLWKERQALQRSVEGMVSALNHSSVGIVLLDQHRNMIFSMVVPHSALDLRWFVSFR